MLELNLRSHLNQIIPGTHHRDVRNYLSWYKNIRNEDTGDIQIWEIFKYQLIFKYGWGIFKYGLPIFKYRSYIFRYGGK